MFEGAAKTLRGRKGATTAWLVALRILPQPVSRALDDPIIVRRLGMRCGVLNMRGFQSALCVLSMRGFQHVPAAKLDVAVTRASTISLLWSTEPGSVPGRSVRSAVLRPSVTKTLL